MTEEKKDPEDPPQANWEYREEFGIVTKMREAISLTKTATESEITLLRRKLERLTYGS
jgi:predicted chitinase